MADKIYVGQTALYLEFNLGIALSNIDEIILKGVSPSGVTSDYDLTIMDAEAGIVQHDVVKIEGDPLATPPTEDEYEFDEAGHWIFYTYILYENGEETYSEPVRIKFYTPGH